ncbi:hypothetical protein LIER_31866 [Lithospermum erythrorhizon]|uniref:Uncharacterized protein n=1 Tax=Lithospermum erythrorhizon TaxID=34254 RepID=A0AAV3RS88_LITER
MYGTFVVGRKPYGSNGSIPLGSKDLASGGSKIGVWRKILALRETLKPHLKYIVENGKTMKCLHDNWGLEEVLVDILSERERTAVRMLPTDTITDFCRKVKWLGGRRLSERILGCKINMHETLTNAKDKMVWFGTDIHCT